MSEWVSVCMSVTLDMCMFVIPLCLVIHTFYTLLQGETFYYKGGFADTLNTREAGQILGVR